MTDPVLGDPQAASGGRRNIPLVPTLEALPVSIESSCRWYPLSIEDDILDHVIRKLHETTVNEQRSDPGWWGTLRVSRIETDAVTGRLGA